MNYTTHDYVADFETTVYAGQEDTAVWSVAFCEVGNEKPENVHLFGSLDEFMVSFKKLGLSRFSHVRIFFHNLKFDGSFILSWLIENKNHALRSSDAQEYFPKDPRKGMQSGEFKYMLSNRGQMYSITYKYGNTVIEFLDSLKLFPMKLSEVGKAFQTKHQKLTMKYEGVRYPNCPISKEEKEYIINDVLVLSEALKEFFDEGYKKTTIGSNCMSEFIKIIGGKEAFYDKFPQLVDEFLLTGENVDAFVRASYKGGYCYCHKRGRFINGRTLDVNSLYPFVMKKFKIPYGLPRYLNYIPEFTEDKYCFIRIKCNFELKKNKLPTIQIKNNLLYKPNEWLKSSFIFDENGIKQNEVIVGSKRVKTQQILTLCESDFLLFREHYNISDFEFIDCLQFPAEKGMFDEYMDKYFKIKMTSTGGRRLMAKLFLNNLYGKFGSSDDSSFKVCYLDNGVLKFRTVKEKQKKTYHVAVASAITGWARYWTITHAQANYEHFIYADTDSLHLDCEADKVKNCVLDKNNIGDWDCELEWEEGVFIRQKTYIERSGKKLNIVACGMGGKCRDNIECAYLYTKDKNNAKKVCKEKELDTQFMEKGFNLMMFKEGLVVPQNLKSRQIKGGALLMEEDFHLR